MSDVIFTDAGGTRKTFKTTTNSGVETLHVNTDQYPYIEVGESETNRALGTGAVGDYIEAVVIKGGGGTTTIKDDTSTMLVIPASTVGTRIVLHWTSQNGPWKVTTASMTQATFTGLFTA